MQVFTLASGSTGNSTLITDNDTAILIDMGISARRLCTALGQLGLSPADLSGILITHEHSDHIGGLKTFVKNYEVPIFAPRTVSNHLRWSVAGVEVFISELSVGNENSVGALSVVPFHTPHDTPESVGYRIAGTQTLGFCTDCGHVSAEMLEGLRHVDCAVIEANHDMQLLLNGRYPAFLKRRIISDVGHLSNEACGALATVLAEDGTSEIVLAHLSRENNTPTHALNAVKAALSKSGSTANVHVAPECEIFSLTLEGCRKC